MTSGSRVKVGAGHKAGVDEAATQEVLPPQLVRLAGHRSIWGAGVHYSPPPPSGANGSSSQ